MTEKLSPLDGGPPPFDMLEAYAFMLWMWKMYPYEVVEFAQEYSDDKKRHHDIS